MWVSRGIVIAVYENAVLIYNPSARGLSGKRAGRLGRVLGILWQAGHRVAAVPTSGPLTAADIARDKIRRGADLVLVAGGDGTLNEVLNGIVHSPIPLGILPAGTANVLACELRLGSLEQAARRLAHCVPRRLAAGLLSATGGPNRHFLLMAGAGFDAHIVHRVDPGLKKQHGKLSYWLAAFGELGRALEQFEVRTADGSFRCSFALASRVRNYGGSLEIARHASLLRDDFGVVLFEGSNSFRYVKYLAGVLARRLEGMNGVSLLRASSLEFCAPADLPVYVQVDGEAAGRLPARVEIVPDAVTLLLPE